MRGGVQERFLTQLQPATRRRTRLCGCEEDAGPRLRLWVHPMPSRQSCRYSADAQAGWVADMLVGLVIDTSGRRSSDAEPRTREALPEPTPWFQVTVLPAPPCTQNAICLPLVLPRHHSPGMHQMHDDLRSAYDAGPARERRGAERVFAQCTVTQVHTDQRGCPLPFE